MPESEGKEYINESVNTLNKARKYTYNELKERIPLVSKISVWETPTSCASYYDVD